MISVGKPTGRLQDRSNWTFSRLGEVSYKKPLFGFNNILYDLYNHLRSDEKKIIHLIGQAGSGKTRLIDQLIRILYERGQYRDSDSFLRLDFKNQSMSRFYKIVEGLKFTRQSFIQFYHHRNVLIIMEDCDKLITTGKDEFVKAIKDLASNLLQAKFIITTRIDMQAKEFHPISLEKIKQERMKPLKKFDTERLILSLMAEKFPEIASDPERLEGSPLFDLKTFKVSIPGVIIERCEKFLKDHQAGRPKFEKFESEMKKIEDTLEANNREINTKKELSEELK